MSVVKWTNGKCCKKCSCCITSKEAFLYHPYSLHLILKWMQQSHLLSFFTGMHSWCNNSILPFYGWVYMWSFSQMLTTKRDYGTRNSVKMCSNETFLKVCIIVNRLALWEELKYASALDIIKSLLTTVPWELVEIVLPPANCFTIGHRLTYYCSAIDSGKEAANKRWKWHEMKWIEMNTHVLQ